MDYGSEYHSEKNSCENESNLTLNKEKRNEEKNIYIYILAIESI